MTGQDLIDFIEANNIGNWLIEVQVNDELMQIEDAVMMDGFIRLYIEDVCE